jgi:hypothetical protein
MNRIAVAILFFCAACLPVLAVPFKKIAQKRHRDGALAQAP